MKKNLSKLSLLLVATAMVFFNGCKKDINHSALALKSLGNSASIPKGYTMTMVGLVPDSNVTLIEEGYKLSFINGHAYKVHIATGVRVKDLGTVMPNMANRNTAPTLMTSGGKNLNASARESILGGSGSTYNWITYSEWQTTNPITYFTTNWKVPNAPKSADGQIFAIWMGLAPKDSGYPTPATQPYPLIQPALVWGDLGGAVGGGQSWTIVSYMIWIDAGGTQRIAISPPQYNVPVGTLLQAQISSSSQQPDGSYNLVSQFVGQTSLTITEHASLTSGSGGSPVNAPFIPVLNYACEVLEIPSGDPVITSLSEYPNQIGVEMNSIGIKTGTTTPTISWESSSANGLTSGAQLGEHTNIVSESDVWIDFQPSPAPVFSYWTPDAFTVSKPITSLNPTNTGSTPTSYAISPSLPGNIGINQTTGLISGQSNTLSAATDYTVTAIAPGGSIGTFALNMAIVNGAFSFLVSTSDVPSIFFNVAVNGGPSDGTFRVGQGQQSYEVNMPCTIQSNSTVVMYIPDAGGIIPTSAGLYGLGAPVYGVISGRTITFSNVNLTAGTSCQIVVD